MTPVARVDTQEAKIDGSMKKLAAACVAALAIDAGAVTLDPDGLGQGLIFPYYTANSARGDVFNTYLSIVNHTAQAKALRVRFREGRASQPTLEFNIFLSANDMWTGAVLPAGEGTALVSRDNSCTDPGFGIDSPTMAFSTSAFGDGAGTEVGRTREGFVEVLEMAVLTGTSAAAVTQAPTGIPPNCGQVRGNVSPLTQAPSGGLSGTLTIINVASGMDFTVNAEALADLASRPYYRLPSDAYPDLNASEIDAVSEVWHNGEVFRSRWNRPVDAVSAVLMRSTYSGEYTLDAGTRSLTDFVVTFPTRHFYRTATQQPAPPFSQPIQWSADCPLIAPRASATWFFNREARGGALAGTDFPELPNYPLFAPCAASVVFSVRNDAAHMVGPLIPTMVLGSTTAGFAKGAIQVSSPLFQNGWIRISPPPGASFDSLATSQRWTAGATGAVLTGAHRYSGLPVVGFTARTFRNDAVSCATGVCQGNYGGAFPLKYQRKVEAVP